MPRGPVKPQPAPGAVRRGELRVPYGTIPPPGGRGQAKAANPTASNTEPDGEDVGLYRVAALKPGGGQLVQQAHDRAAWAVGQMGGMLAKKQLSRSALDRVDLALQEALSHVRSVLGK